MPDPYLNIIGITVSVCMLVTACMVMLAAKSISSGTALYFAIAFGSTGITWALAALLPQGVTVDWTLFVVNFFGAVGMTAMWCGLWRRSGRAINRWFMSTLLTIWLVPVIASIAFDLHPGTHVPPAVLSIALGVVSSAWYMHTKVGVKNAGDKALTAWLVFLLPVALVGLLIGTSSANLDPNAVWIFYLGFLPTLLTGVGLFALLSFTLEAIANSDELARKDGLTGLHNRRAFDDELLIAASRAERYQRDLSLILLDIDHFKNLNDTYGHPAGDAVLRAVGRVLVERARRIDVVARIGGEEFAIILADTPPAAALRLAERLRQAIGNASSESIAFSASFGVADVEHAGYEPSLIFKAADEALYAAKEAGRNCVRYAVDPAREPSALIGAVS